MSDHAQVVFGLNHRLPTIAGIPLKIARRLGTSYGALWSYGSYVAYSC